LTESKAQNHLTEINLSRKPIFSSCDWCFFWHL